MPLYPGIPYQPYNFLIKKLDGLIVAQDDKGRIRFSGADAITVIQSALDALTSGRTWIETLLALGNFVVDKPIKMPAYTKLLIDGSIKLADGSNCNIIENVDPSTREDHKIIRGGILDGNKANQTAGHGITLYGRHIIIENVHIENIYDTAIQIFGIGADFAWRVWITDCRIINARVKGIRTNVSTRDVFICFNTIRNKEPTWAADNNVDIDGNTIWLIGNHISGTDKSAIICRAIESVIAFNRTEGSREHSLYLWDSNYNRIIGNQFATYASKAANTYDGILLDGGSSYNIISNNIVSTGETPRYDINEVNGNYNIIVGNYLGKTLVNKVGTNTLAWPNIVIGGLQINSGTITLSGDGIVTDFLIGNHGLAENPTDRSRIYVKVTPASGDAVDASPCVAYVSDEDADGAYESIRVKFASAPVAGTGNVVVRWKAQLH